MTALRTLCLALALCLTSSTLAFGQGMPESSQQKKDREFQLAFQEGLYALTGRNMKRAYQLFNQAIKLYPERPTSYYNLACAYSIDNKPEQVAKYIRLAFERGFNDLAHMSRDMDLDTVRNAPAYRKVRKELEEAALLNVPPALFDAPASATGKVPLYVVIHGDNDVPAVILDQVMNTVNAVAPGAVLVPQAPFEAAEGQDKRAWRNDTERGAGRLEFVVMNRVREFLADNPKVDAQRIYLVGLGFSGYKAVSIAGHHPDVFSGVYAHGPILGAEAGELSTKTKAYLVVDPRDPAQVASGVEARDTVYASKGAAVLERYNGTPNDGLTGADAPLARGLAWLNGKAVKLPKAGEAVPF